MWTGCRWSPPRPPPPPRPRRRGDNRRCSAPYTCEWLSAGGVQSKRDTRSVDSSDAQHTEEQGDDDERGDSDNHHRLGGAARLEAPRALRREADAHWIRPEPGNAADGQAVGDEVQEVADQQCDERYAAYGGPVDLRSTAGAERDARTVEAQIVESPGERVLRSPDEGADDDQADEAMEKGAVPGDALEASTDEAKAFAEGAAGVVNVGGKSAQRRAGIEDALEHQLVCRLVGISWQRRA